MSDCVCTALEASVAPLTHRPADYSNSALIEMGQNGALVYDRRLREPIRMVAPLSSQVGSTRSSLSSGVHLCLATKLYWSSPTTCWHHQRVVVSDTPVMGLPFCERASSDSATAAFGSELCQVFGYLDPWLVHHPENRAPDSGQWARRSMPLPILKLAAGSWQLALPLGPGWESCWMLHRWYCLHCVADTFQVITLDTACSQGEYFL